MVREFLRCIKLDELDLSAAYAPFLGSAPNEQIFSVPNGYAGGPKRHAYYSHDRQTLVSPFFGIKQHPHS